MRPSERQPNELRPLLIEPAISRHAEGSCSIRFGNTELRCTASLEEKVPPFLRNSGRGWVTAEYGMLPRATGSRMAREAARGKQSGRTQEIQRLIGRSLRAVVDLEKLGERQVTIDCDVIEADGGTRTAAISGGFVALHQAIQGLLDTGELKEDPMVGWMAAVSCGVYKGVPVLDLDYPEDSEAEADANFVLTENGHIVEIQATAEDRPIPPEHFDAMLGLARKGIGEIIAAQREALAAIARKAA